MGYILDKSTVIDIASQLRNQNKDVVFTHGAFDLFHTGHSYVLEESRRLGDVLIVGVEPDANVTKYKGSKRPIISQEDRAHILAMHTGVDFVLDIDELNEVASDYYIDLYKRIFPSTVTVGKNFYDKNRHRINIKDISIKRLNMLIDSPKTHNRVSTTSIIYKINKLKDKHE